jgi:hypothetical protein
MKWRTAISRRPVGLAEVEGLEQLGVFQDLPGFAQVGLQIGRPAARVAGQQGLAWTRTSGPIVVG